ncbi:MAG TPA: hypothetical protein VGG46_13240 [Terriglobales bacterium]|jgi:hypothetical protein
MAVDMGFDESGSHDILLLSVQVGVVQKARRMKTAWKTLLREAKIPFFHSVDYGNFSKGIFKHLSRDERQELLSSLSGNLRKRMLFGITGKVTISNWNSKTDPKFRGEWAAAYSFAMQMLMLETRVILEKLRVGYDVNILLEDGHKNAGQAINILRSIKEKNKHRPEDAVLNILTEGLGSKTDYPILQAADMLGYSEWQSLIQSNREIYDALHVKGSRYFTVYMDMDKHLVDPALEIAKRSDAAKAIFRELDRYRRTGSVEGLKEAGKRIREFRQKYEEVDNNSNRGKVKAEKSLKKKTQG